MVDGSSRLGAFVRILLPLVGARSRGDVGLLLRDRWNEYIFASVMLSDQSQQTVTVWLSDFYGTSRNTDWGGLMAASTLTADPGRDLLRARAATDRLRAHRRRRPGAVTRRRRRRHPRTSSLIPRPVSAARVAGSSCSAPTRRSASVAARPRRRADQLAGRLRPATGYRLPVTPRARVGSGDVELALDPRSPRSGPKGIGLRVERDGVMFRGSRAEGLFRGVQTLRQLFDPAIGERNRCFRAQWRIRIGTIETGRDSPGVARCWTSPATSSARPR